MSKDDERNLGPDALFMPGYKSSFGSVFEKPLDDWKGPDGLALEQIKNTAERMIKAMESMPCKGSRVNIEETCPDLIEASCKKREFSSCPRRIMAMEKSRVASEKRGDRSERRMLSDMGIPGLIVDHLVARDYVMDNEAMVDGLAWWESRPRPLLLVMFGLPDSGKSFVAGYLVARYAGRMVHVNSLVEKAKKQPGYLEPLRTVKLLAIDDLGKERMDGFDDAKSLICDLICQRTDDGLYTILPLNMHPEVFAERYEDHVFGRVQGFGKIRAVKGDLRNLSRLAPHAPIQPTEEEAQEAWHYSPGESHE